MAIHRFTPAQRSVLREIANGMIIKKSGHGFSLHDASGKWVGTASVAVKSLAGNFLLAKAEDRIYFTTRGYNIYFGGQPTGEAAKLCGQADERVAYVKSMMNEAK